jgi:hypothetical protein
VFVVHSSSLAAIERAAIDAAGGVPLAHPMRLPCAVAASLCRALGIAPVVYGGMTDDDANEDCGGGSTNGGDDDDDDDDDGRSELRRALHISDTAYGGGWELFEARWGDMLHLLPADVVADVAGGSRHRRST